MLSVHAPTLLVTQRVWGTDPWEKIDRSMALADELGADTVVLHPPFRWQREYARDFVDGVAVRSTGADIRLAVENMYPWRGPRSRELEAYLPHWDPVPQPYDHVTLDLSHTSTSGSDAMEMVRAARAAPAAPAPGRRGRLGARRAPRARARHPAVRRGARDARGRGYAGHVVVEVATRRAGEAQRELDLAEALAFARLHLADAAGRSTGVRSRLVAWRAVERRRRLVAVVPVLPTCVADAGRS